MGPGVPEPQPPEALRSGSQSSEQLKAGPKRCPRWEQGEHDQVRSDYFNRLLDVGKVQKLRQLEAENVRLKQMVADYAMANQLLREKVEKN